MTCRSDSLTRWPAGAAARRLWRALRRGAGAAGLGAAAAAGLAGCVTAHVAIESRESFDSTTTFSRTYPALAARTCEAARRTLLSQGYVVAVANAEQVRGRKSFQPAAETHVEVEFTIVCAGEGDSGRRTIAFVNAVQDSFALKKSSTSASVGLPAFGALSLPFLGSEESLVKVASVTIDSAAFYDRFFLLLERYLAGDPGQFMPPVAARSASPPLAGTPASSPVPGR